MAIVFTSERILTQPLCNLPQASRQDKIAQALKSEKYQLLIKHAKGHELLTQRLQELYETNSTFEDFLDFKTAVSDHNWSHPLLYTNDAENFAILLYITNEILQDDFINLAIIIAAYNQFINCVPNTLPTTNTHGLTVPTDTITKDNFLQFFIPSISCEVKDLSLSENHQIAESFFRMVGHANSQLMTNSPRRLILPIAAKELAFKEMVNRGEKFEVICVKFPSAVSTRIFSGAEKIGKTPISICEWIAELKTSAPYIGAYSHDQSMLLIPTFMVVKQFFKKQRSYVQGVPVLGEISADEMKCFRWINQHPIVFHNALISNNVNVVHGLFSGKIFSALHDLTHITKQNKVTEEVRRLELHMDSVLLKLGKGRIGEPRTPFWSKRIETLLLEIKQSCSETEHSTPLADFIERSSKLNPEQQQDLIPKEVIDYANNDEQRSLLDQINGECEGCVISDAFEGDFLRFFAWRHSDSPVNLVVFCHLCIHLEEQDPSQRFILMPILMQLEEKMSGLLYSPYKKRIEINLKLLSSSRKRY